MDVVLTYVQALSKFAYNWRRNKSLKSFGASSFIIQIATPEENQAFFLDLLFSLFYVTF